MNDIQFFTQNSCQVPRAAPDDFLFGPGFLKPAITPRETKQNHVPKILGNGRPQAAGEPCRCTLKGGED